MEKNNEKKLLDFLYTVNMTFPVPLSHKQNLSKYADKLMERGTLCTEIRNNRIVSLVAGYTDDVVNNQAYISLVATIPEFYGRGFATNLVKKFIAIAKKKELEAVHLYTDCF